MAARRYPARAGPIPDGVPVVEATRPDDCWARSVAVCAAVAATVDLRAVPAGSEEYPMAVPCWLDPLVGPCGGADPSAGAYRGRYRSPGAVSD